ncbi:metal-sensitive transcriptional regulator [Streptomyces phaeochromogenes]|uniref:metal-sensitive transcriptional regulator n=1 Tax=Streptomyces phaeochromogenes TaxID=1923 RepID=UPI002E28E903|nr:metal-sensitive transcriptional regulator [Streptomyces phaeochromogenes]
MTTASGHGLSPRVSEPPGYHSQKADHLSRLHKIEGQVRGVARVVDEDRYCIDVLTQIGAVTRALQEVALGLLDDHARNCLLTAASSDPEEADAKLDELALAMRRLTRM